MIAEVGEHYLVTRTGRKRLVLVETIHPKKKTATVRDLAASQNLSVPLSLLVEPIADGRLARVMEAYL